MFFRELSALGGSVWRAFGGRRGLGPPPSRRDQGPAAKFWLKIPIKPKVGYYDLYIPATHVIYIGGGVAEFRKNLNFFFLGFKIFYEKIIIITEFYVKF